MLRYGYFWVRGDEQEPVKTFDMISWLGWNHGTYGHLCPTQELAEDAYKRFLDNIVNQWEAHCSHGEAKNAFSNPVEEIEFLKNNVALFQINIKQL